MALVFEAEKMQDDEVAVRLGRGLKQARALAGVNGAELARRLTAAGVNETGIPSSQVYRWESGERPLNLRLIETSERLMGLRPGTVLRLAGYVDDDGLVDVDTLEPWARRSIQALLRQVEQDRSVRNNTLNNGDGVVSDNGDSPEGAS